MEKLEINKINKGLGISMFIVFLLILLLIDYLTSFGERNSTISIYGFDPISTSSIYSDYLMSAYTVYFMAFFIVIQLPAFMLKNTPWEKKKKHKIKIIKKIPHSKDKVEMENLMAMVLNENIEDDDKIKKEMEKVKPDIENMLESIAQEPKQLVNLNAKYTEYINFLKKVKSMYEDDSNIYNKYRQKYLTQVFSLEDNLRKLILESKSIEELKNNLDEFLIFLGKKKSMVVDADVENLLHRYDTVVNRKEVREIISQTIKDTPSNKSLYELMKSNYRLSAIIKVLASNSGIVTRFNFSTRYDYTVNKNNIYGGLADNNLFNLVKNNPKALSLNEYALLFIHYGTRNIEINSAVQQVATYGSEKIGKFINANKEYKGIIPFIVAFLRAMQLENYPLEMLDKYTTRYFDYNADNAAALYLLKDNVNLREVLSESRADQFIMHFAQMKKAEEQIAKLGSIETGIAAQVNAINIMSSDITNSIDNMSANVSNRIDNMSANVSNRIDNMSASVSSSVNNMANAQQENNRLQEQSNTLQQQSNETQDEMLDRELDKKRKNKVYKQGDGSIEDMFRK